MHIYYNRGLAYANKEDYNIAIEDFVAALWLDPNLTPAMDALAEAKRMAEAQKANR
jgi:tetratricopeptide (TPR) repeat protein